MRLFPYVFWVLLSLAFVSGESAKALEKKVPFSGTSAKNHSSSCTLKHKLLWGQPYVWQWVAARRELNIRANIGKGARAVKPCQEELEIAAYIEGRPSWIGLPSNTPYGGVLVSYRIPKNKCWSVSTDGRSIIEYHRIWKDGNTKICEDFGQFMHKDTNNGIKYPPNPDSGYDPRPNPESNSLSLT